MLSARVTSGVARRLWEASFEAQVAQAAYNTAPVEAVIRTVSYHLRGRYSTEALQRLHFLELGCGAGANLLWLAERGLRVSGIDLAPTALRLARQRLNHAGVGDRIRALVEGSVTHAPFEDESFDGIIEACVFQHLSKGERRWAFGEVKRLLKPGGLFVGYLLDVGHTVFQQKRAKQVPDDPGTLILADGGSPFYLTNLGMCHFFERGEVLELLEGFSVVNPCRTAYELPQAEAQRRGYPQYLQSMWTVYAVK